MSYNILLVDKNGDNVTVPLHQEGCTICIQGSAVAHMSVTYNYLDFFSPHICKDKGLEALNGKSGEDSIPILEKAVKGLGTDLDEDYWEPTEGNAGHALNVMLRWAKHAPEARWYIR